MVSTSMQTVSHERHLHVTTLSPVFALSYNFAAEWRGRGLEWFTISSRVSERCGTFPSTVLAAHSKFVILKIFQGIDASSSDIIPVLLLNPCGPGVMPQFGTKGTVCPQMD